MRNQAMLIACVAVVSFLAHGLARGDDDAVAKDRKTIAGTWQVHSLRVKGRKAAPEDVKKLQVINQADGTWSIKSDGKVIVEGTSAIDPAKRPKTIDFQVTTGDSQGDKFQGIYSLKQDRRRLCFAKKSDPRPTKFESTESNGQILVTFRRLK